MFSGRKSLVISNVSGREHPSKVLREGTTALFNGGASSFGAFAETLGPWLLAPRPPGLLVAAAAASSLSIPVATAIAMLRFDITSLASRDAYVASAKLTLPVAVGMERHCATNDARKSPIIRPSPLGLG